MNQADCIQVAQAAYSYEEKGDPALWDTTLSVRPGEMVAVLGHNGSGKSTLAKLLNALYLPTSGKVLILGMDTADGDKVWEIRQQAGMIFQNPDNQMVASVVKEDVAFGLENMAVPPEEMMPRIETALAAVHMNEYADAAPHMLSGGQKQRVGIAGVLAMEPSIIIADEATAMLDPSGRQEVLDTIRQLNRTKGITVIWITHYMEEAALADRVVVISGGRIALEGTPREVFRQVDTLRSLSLDVPHMTSLAHSLQAQGIDFPGDVLTVEEMTEEVARRLCPSKSAT